MSIRFDNSDAALLVAPGFFILHVVSNAMCQYFSSLFLMFEFIEK